MSAGSKIFFVAFFLIFVVSTQAAELRPFTSDGCSAFPEGTSNQNQLWLECCVAHDYAYWKGGSYQQRRRADYQLKQCVDTVGEGRIANIMLAGVRVGGSPFWPTQFRWGYGWPYPHFYGELNEQELAQVNSFPTPKLIVIANPVQANISDQFGLAMAILILLNGVSLSYLITRRNR